MKPKKFNGFHSAIEVWHSELKDVWSVYLVNEIETDQLELLRKRYKDRGLKPPSYTALVIKAIALAIDAEREQFPELNGFIWRFLFFRKIHIYQKISCGCVVAVDMDGEDRVAVGVVQEPQKKSLSEVTEAVQGFSQPGSTAMKNVSLFYGVPKILQRFFNWIGALSPSIRYENRGTFNITSVGKFGVDIQTVPQSASLQFGFGLIRDRVVARDGKPVVVPTFNLTVAFDRRIMNGKPASLVMDRIRKILQSPDLGGTEK